MVFPAFIPNVLNDTLGLAEQKLYAAMSRAFHISVTCFSNLKIVAHVVWFTSPWALEALEFFQEAKGKGDI